MTRGRPRGQKLCSHGVHDWPLEVFERHLGKRSPLDIPVGDQVEGDVEAAGLRDHAVGVLVDRLLVERIQRGGVGHAARIADVGCHGFEPLQCPAGQVHPCPLARERTRDGAADRRAAVEERHGPAALASRKPFRDRLGRARPVGSFSKTQREAQRHEASQTARQRGGHGGNGIPEHGQAEAHCQHGRTEGLGAWLLNRDQQEGYDEEQELAVHVESSTRSAHKVITQAYRVNLIFPLPRRS